MSHNILSTSTFKQTNYRPTSRVESKETVAYMTAESENLKKKKKNRRKSIRRYRILTCVLVYERESKKEGRKNKT